MTTTKSSPTFKWFSIGAAGATTLAGGIVALRKEIPKRLFDLPPATHTTNTVRSVPISAEDGTTLVHDAIFARSDEPLPVILMRTPYGRGLKSLEGLSKQLIGGAFAKRGYHFIIQDCRGTGESRGNFEAYINEQSDAKATIDWLAKQPWCNGKVGMFGQSYVGFTQWAAAASGAPELQAMVTTITQARLGGFPENAYPLDLALRWLLFMDASLNEGEIGSLEQARRLLSASYQNKFLADGFTVLPLAKTPEAVFGRSNPIFEKWVEHADPNDPYWDVFDHREHVASAAPAHHIAGWHDLFLDGQLEDYARQVEGGKRPYLTVGPWTHLDFANQSTMIGETLRWFDFHLKGKAGLRPHPVRVHLMKANKWLDLPQWPPETTPLTYYLSGTGNHDGGLQRVPTAPHNPPSEFVYDPSDPTPNIGGKLISGEAGESDNRPLEARGDVLTFTTPPLTQDVDIVGAVSASVYFKSNAVSADVFARLCDVQPDGRSLNVCDDLVRLDAPDGTEPVEVPLSSTAYRFKAGHRIRLQLSSGAHPRFARNLGTQEEWMYATEMISAENTLFHDAEHPSTLTLPIFDA